FRASIRRPRRTGGAFRFICGRFHQSKPPCPRPPSNPAYVPPATQSPLENISYPRIYDSGENAPLRGEWSFFVPILRIEIAKTSLYTSGIAKPYGYHKLYALHSAEDRVVAGLPRDSGVLTC